MNKPAPAPTVRQGRLAGVLAELYAAQLGPAWPQRLGQRRPEENDIKHVVRAEFCAHYRLGPSEYARLEGLLTGRTPHPSTIRNSLLTSRHQPKLRPIRERVRDWMAAFYPLP